MGKKKKPHLALHTKQTGERSLPKENPVIFLKGSSIILWLNILKPRCSELLKKMSV